jgi:hypothetical protein
MWIWSVLPSRIWWCVVRFGGTCILHYHGWRSLLPASCWFFTWLTLRLWRCRRHVPSKRWLIFSGLHNHRCDNLRTFSTSYVQYIAMFAVHSKSGGLANQFVLATSPLRLTTGNFIFQLNTYSYNPYVTSWVCRLQLLLVLASAVILRSESRATHDHIFTVSDSRLPQPGGSGPRIYIPQEQGGPVITPGTGFPFRRLLQLAGLRWRYSALPPGGVVWGPSPIYLTWSFIKFRPFLQATTRCTVMKSGSRVVFEGCVYWLVSTMICLYKIFLMIFLKHF